LQEVDVLQPFRELRERLLRGGVAPRHVRRYLRELTDHFADLVATEERAGRTRAEAEALSLARLGTVDTLAEAMLQQPRLRSWTARLPWAIFTLAPLSLLAAAYFIACFILWSGWQIFLPNNTTPFVRLDGILSILYFGIGRILYFGAPIFTGWAFAVLAVRQRFTWLWPTLAFVLVCLVGATADLHTHRPANGIGQVSMSFIVGNFTYPNTILRALLILPIAALPYVIWRFQNRRFATS
jgi:hypothetical protein